MGLLGYAYVSAEGLPVRDICGVHFRIKLSPELTGLVGAE